jgi:hypothetical protein
LDKFEGKTTTGAFVAVDRGRHKDEVGTDKVSYEWEGDGGCFVYDNEFGLAEDVGVFRLNILNKGSTRKHLAMSKG